MSSLQRTPPLIQCINSGTTITNLTKRSRSDDDAAPSLTLEAILSTMNDQFAKTLERIDCISNKIDGVKNELQGKLDAVSRHISAIKTDCAVKFTSHEAAICALDKRVESITQEIGGLANRNELIVNGIPYMKGENLMSYFKSMWKHVGLHEDHTPMVDIRRLKADTRGNSIILLQFALRNNRDDFYSGYLRTLNLQLSHLGIDSSRRVYLNENLTVAARKIKAAALRLRKVGKLSSVYTKLGIVYVKRPDDQQFTPIHTEEQLNIFTTASISS